MSDNKTREELNTYDFNTLVNLVVTLQYRLSDKEKSEQELKEELKGLRQESIELNSGYLPRFIGLCDNRLINEKSVQALLSVAYTLYNTHFCACPLII